VRRYSTAIVIAVAAVLVAVIVVASGTREEAGGLAYDPAATLPPAGHRTDRSVNVAGVVDTASVEGEIAALERARRANPGSLRIMLDLGAACRRARLYDAAAAAYRDALAASPGHPNAAVGLAMVWSARGDHERALRRIERVLAAFPDHQEAQYDLALVRFAHGDVAEARQAWVKAAAIDPSSRLGRVAQDFVALLADAGAVMAAP